MISSFQNFSVAGNGGALQYGYVPTASEGQQLQSVYDVVAAATAGQHGVYNVPGGQQPVAVPYHPAEYGFIQQQQQQQQQRQQPPPPPPPPSRYQEPRRPPRPQQATTPEPPNRKRPAQHASPPPQQQQQQHPAPVQYTRVQNDVAGGKTSLHAIIDYDDEDILDYYEDYNHSGVTPIQGPIYLRNGSVPVVPLYGYQKVNNGSFLQIPVLWTALSFALGYEIGGEVIRGTPCIKRNHQLFCPTAGKSYPIDRIDRFIDENKALMKRMYGEFEMMENGPFPQEKRSTTRKRRQDTNFSDNQSKSNKLPTKGQPADSGRVDSCESKVEVVTPYWASNSVGKTRAIVNTEHFEQAIHQEVCTKTLTSRCSGDCGCEQKYKWHRLLAYDPNNDCKGIFMDWFLFPSCCVCRCDSTTPNNV